MQTPETWWWNPTVQKATAKKRTLKKWQHTKAQECHAEYKTAKKESKIGQNRVGNRQRVGLGREVLYRNIYSLCTLLLYKPGRFLVLRSLLC